MYKLADSYYESINEWFYLDQDDITIRRAKNGYFGRYNKDDIVKPYCNTAGYLMVHLPKTRRSISFATLLCVLRGIPMPLGYDVDHIDGDTTNNARTNLRMVNRRLNNRNRCKRSDNTSGITGIRWSEYHKHYVIRKTIGKQRLSRSRKTLDEAKIVLQELCKMDATYTERHGK